MPLNKLKSIRFSGLLLLICLLWTGGFNEYISCALSAALCVYLLFLLHKKKVLLIRKDLPSLAVTVLCLGYGLTCFWAIDKGMAFIGFLKFLPLALFMLLLWQEEESSLLQLLPYFGAVFALLSAGASLLPLPDNIFVVAGRLAGFFQYPNTFAVFLLVCQLLLLKKEGKKLWDYAAMAILLAALLYTGSRTVFVLAVVSNIAMLLLIFRKKGRILLLSLLGIVCLVAGILALDEGSVLRRYLTISLTESTFVGRLLYFADALPLLLKYPFGMGYMGYAYVQNSIQTGVYSVTYIHNDFLQILLDVGLIPGGLFIAAVVSWFFRKNVSAPDKIITATLCLHSLFDFNLQYIGMFLLLLLLMGGESGKKAVTVKGNFLIKAALPVTAAVCLYIGSALMIGHFGGYPLSDAMYPFNTQNKLKMLSAEEDISKANAMADDILQWNTQYFAPYSVKAKYAYSQGDFTSMIQHKRTVFSLNPFRYEEYEEYCQMLIYGIMLYQQAGDRSSADFCKNELLAAKDLLAANEARLSPLGKMITDQPVTQLSEQIQTYIAQMEGK